MAPPTNQRRFTRIPIAFRARVIWYGGAFNAPEAIDISMGGVLLRTDVRMPVGAECHLVLFIVSDGKEYKVLASARVTRQDPRGLAFNFTELRGEDSQANLQQLLLRYAAQPSTVQAELAGPGKVPVVPVPPHLPGRPRPLQGN